MHVYFCFMIYAIRALCEAARALVAAALVLLWPPLALADVQMGQQELQAPLRVSEQAISPIRLEGKKESPEDAVAADDSKIENVRLMYTPGDGLYLYAEVHLYFPDVVKDALEQGIPVYFSAQARVVQPRWWWFDGVAAEQHRFWRLSYQPLTRKWRVQSSTISSEQTDQALGLAQSFDTLDEALVRIEHISSWKIADERELVAGEAYEVEFTLGLDISRVPRPLLISEAGKNFGDMQLQWNQHFPMPK